MNFIVRFSCQDLRHYILATRMGLDCFFFSFVVFFGEFVVENEIIASYLERVWRPTT